MQISRAALITMMLRERQKMTNAKYWSSFTTEAELESISVADKNAEELERLSEELTGEDALPNVDAVICPFDTEFPAINPNAPKSQRPILLFCRGNLSLLQNLNANAAVIGSLNPDQPIAERETSAVKHLVDDGLRVVSGLANGCDSIAHKACLDAGGKTIAILPTHLAEIYPANNRKLAHDIIEEGGLLVSEYAGAPTSRYAAIKRFTERDRLQALFSKAVILIASNRKGEGDSGSRYAMESAKKYRLRRYVMFDKKRDFNNPLFGLNKDLLAEDSGIEILTPENIGRLAKVQNKDLIKNAGGVRQLTLV